MNTTATELYVIKHPKFGTSHIGGRKPDETIGWDIIYREKQQAEERVKELGGQWYVAVAPTPLTGYFALRPAPDGRRIPEEGNGLIFEGKPVEIFDWYKALGGPPSYEGAHPMKG